MGRGGREQAVTDLPPDLQQTLKAAALNRGECPGMQRLLEYASLESHARQAHPDHAHVQLCSRCQLIVISTEHEPERAGLASRPWRWIGIAVPVAAALVLTMILIPRMVIHEPPPESGIRGSSIQLLAPVGTVRQIAPFRWESPIRAESFRIYIYDGPTLQWSGTVHEPQASPPESALQPGREYTWYVEALDREGEVRMTSPRQTFVRAP